MKRDLIILTAMLIGICSGVLAGAGTHDVDYFTVMRMDTAKRPDFNPDWERDEARENITDLWNQDKTAEGLVLAKKWLETYPVDVQMHAWTAYFLLQTGDYQGYFYHSHMHHGLLASITSSGTGQSLDSPMKVISISEEYAVLRAMDAKLIQQSLVANDAGAMCDAMECQIGEKSITLYFDVSISLAHFSKMFEDPQVDPGTAADTPASGIAPAAGRSGGSGEAATPVPKTGEESAS